MKEIIKASLAGIGFVFDQDAYEITEAYLDKLAGIYKSNPDGREIIADIEARMVEIILSRQTSDQVVSLETAREVISQMGTPEQVGGESAVSVPAPVDGPFPRRLYRNLDGAKLGGVCNGLGSYFDVDPVFVRIAMASPLFFLIIFPSPLSDSMRLTHFWVHFSGPFACFTSLCGLLSRPPKPRGRSSK